MSFNIPKDQQKLFVEHFMQQVLDVALDMVDQGKDLASPGATIHAVGKAVIRQLYGMQAPPPGPAEGGPLND